MNSKPANNHGTVTIINPFKVWEKLYFYGEEAITNASRNFVSTPFFGRAAEMMLNHYLQMVRMQSAFVNNVLEDWPFPTKKDTARLARMVISLERKVDLLQLELEDLGYPEHYAGSDGPRDSAPIRTEPNPDVTLIITVLQDLANRINKLDNLVHTHNQILMESRALSRKAPCLLELAAEESLLGGDVPVDPAETITIFAAGPDEQ